MVSMAAISGQNRQITPAATAVQLATSRATQIKQKSQQQQQQQQAPVRMRLVTSIRGGL